MMQYCANCDTEATIRLVIQELKGRKRTLYLCAKCDDAFQWGFAHGEEQDSIVGEDPYEGDEEDADDLREDTV